MDQLTLMYQEIKALTQYFQQSHLPVAAEEKVVVLLMNQ